MLLNNSFKFILSISKQNDSFVLFRKLCSEVPQMRVVKARGLEFQTYKKLIFRYMRFNHKESSQFLHNNSYIFCIPESKIIKYCEICERHGVNLSDVKGNTFRLFQLSQEELVTRILIFKEMGAKNIPGMMLNGSSQNVHANLFRILGKVRDNVDLVESLYSHLHDPPPSVPPMPSLNENMSIKQMRSECLSHYLQWRLEIPPENTELLDKLIYTLIYTNFARIKAAFDVLHYDIGMSIETIRDNNCLNGCSGADLRRILRQCNTICGVSIPELIKSTPMLTKLRFSNVSPAKQLLEKFEFTGDQLKNCLKILFIEKEHLKVGLTLMTKRTELQILRRHPQVLHIFLMKEELDWRINYLDYLNLKNASISILTKSVDEFDRTMKVGRLHNNIEEISWIINQHMSLNPSDIKECLSKHQYWNKIDLVTLYDTFHFLLTIFSVDDIKNNLRVILYSKSKVASTLDKMKDADYLLNPENDFTPCQILTLCEYEIEKQHHFTGDGVWEEENEDTLTVSTEFIYNPQQWRDRYNALTDVPGDGFGDYCSDNIDNDNIGINVNFNEDIEDVLIESNDDDDYEDVRLVSTNKKQM